MSESATWSTLGPGRLRGGDGESVGLGVCGSPSHPSGGTHPSTRSTLGLSRYYTEAGRVDAEDIYWKQRRPIDR